MFSILGALVLFWAFDHVNLVWVMMCEFSYSRAIYSRVERIEHRDDFEFRLNTDQSTQQNANYVLYFLIFSQ